MKLICGLGNPGREYERHRHNVGFMVVDELARRGRAISISEKFDGILWTGTLADQKVLLLKPLTYMNESGRSLAACARFYKLPPDDVLVVHDELDLPFGRLKLQKGGGSGGHHGIESIIASWGESGFCRLRFGIGKPESKERVVGYVLTPFSPEEQKRLDERIRQAADAAECWVREGLKAAMNKFNRRVEPGLPG